MKRAVRITTAAIDEAALASIRAISRSVGAVIAFQGIVRESEGVAKIVGIEYEAFEAMAQHQFQKILTEIEARWPIESVRIVHRIGFVAANEASLWVEVTAGHRGEAFAACQYLIDQMKLRVPIWKRPIESPATAQTFAPTPQREEQPK
jgi:molybdopterin synthase catalytic subunit